MNKKQIVILVIVTNAISISLVSMILTSGRSQQEDIAPAKISDSKPKQVQQAPEITQQNIKINIDSVIAQYDVIKSDRYRESMEAYKQAIRQEPPYTSDSTTPANYYAKQGYYDKAIKVCEEAILEAPKWPANYYTLAWVHAKMGRYEKAIEISTQAIQLHPRYAQTWHILGWVYARLGQHDKAIDACNKALELDPESPWAYYGLGRIYAILGNNEKAAESYKQAIRLKPDNAEVHLFLGITYAELGDQEKAIESYRQAILFDSYYPEPHFFLAVAYDESGQYKKAIESFEEATKWYYHSQKTKLRIHGIGIKPDLANINCIIGVCYLRLDEPFEASLSFKKAINIDDSHAGAHYGLALAHLLLGDKDAAILEYEAVKALKGEEKTKSLLDIIHKNTSLER
ncbi:tetratricopeptide repeat protein [Planctomycetota bacterium]